LPPEAVPGVPGPASSHRRGQALRVLPAHPHRAVTGPADTDHQSLLVWSDGAARGNPGPAGIGALVQATDGTVVAEVSEGIGVATNNVAEYRAALAGLRAARPGWLRPGPARARPQGAQQGGRPPGQPGRRRLAGRPGPRVPAGPAGS